MRAAGKTFAIAVAAVALALAYANWPAEHLRAGTLHVSYPNAHDRLQAAQLGVPPGGDIMIHGLPKAIGWLGRLQRFHDWTAGCMAVTNPEMDDIYSAVADGTPIEIRR